MPRHKPGHKIPKETLNFKNQDDTLDEIVNQRVSNPVSQDVTLETEELNKDNSNTRKQEDITEEITIHNLSGLSADNTTIDTNSIRAKEEYEQGISSTVEQHQQEKQTLHPFVYWAQSHTHVTLRVELTQVEDLRVNLLIGDSDGKLIFSAKGKGAQGLQHYQFEIEFFDKVDEKFDCHKIERHVLILIKKLRQPEKWSRLTKFQSKLPWLRVDFDRYGGDDDDDSDDTSEELNENKFDAVDQDKQFYSSLSQKFHETEQQRINYSSNNQQASANANASKKKNISRDKNFDIFNPFNKSSRIGDTNTDRDMKYDYRKNGTTTLVDNGKNSSKQLSYKKVYLFLYNLAMFVMFLKVYIVLIVKFSSGTMDDEILKSVAFIIKTLTYTQLLETVHPMLGLVPGGPSMPFTQVIGRILVNYFLTDPVIRINSAPHAHYLFIVWSSIEIFRYSFYALRIFKVDVYQITWCRYSLFLPLYPMGAFFEIMVLLTTVQKYETTGEFSIGLPNRANFALNMPTCLRIYSFGLLIPTVMYLMKYMLNQRGKQLRVKQD